MCSLKLILGGIALLIATPVFASNTLYMPSNTALTAPFGNAKLSGSGQINPAHSFTNTQRFRSQLLTGSLSLEARGLGSFVDFIEGIETDAQELQTSIEDDLDSIDILDLVEAFEDTLNNGFSGIGERFNLLGGAHVQVPLLPLQLNTPWLPGTLTFGASTLFQANTSVLYSDISFDVSTTDIDEDDFEVSNFLNTATSLYLKYGRTWNFSLAYAQPVDQLRLGNMEAVVGARGTLIGASLTKNIYPFQEVLDELFADDGDANAYLRSILDDIQNGASDNQLDWTFALDLGVSLSTPRSHLGLTAVNINNPSIAYNTLGENCLSLPTNQQTNCLIADALASNGQIARKEIHTMNPQFMVDASYSWGSNRIVLGGFAFLNAGTNLFGDTSQQVGASLVFQPHSWYWPRFRLGAQKDVQDWKPTTLALGLTLFNVLQLDQTVRGNLADLTSKNTTKQLDALRGAATSASINIAF